MTFIKFMTLNFMKYFFIVFIALELFFVGGDALKYTENFPDSANLIVLFFFYDMLYAINYTLPISIILASVIFYISLLKSNQLTALLSIGYSRSKVLMPTLAISLIITFTYIGLNATPFVYAQESAEAIVNGGANKSVQENILVKYDGSYVYFSKIYPLLSKAQDIKIFEVQDRKLRKFIYAQDAYFQNNSWVLSNATTTNISPSFSTKEKPLSIQKEETLKVLSGFRPKVLDTLYQDKPSVSIIDALSSAKILIDQNIDFGKIRAILYSFIVIPLFVPLTIIVIAFYIPNLSRYGNLALLSFTFVIMSLIIWGLFFSLSKLSVREMIAPEIGILIPMAILFAISVWHYRRINLH